MSEIRLIARLMKQKDVDEVMNLHHLLFPIKYSKDTIASFLNGSFTSILLTKIENGIEEIIGVSTSYQRRKFYIFGELEGYLSTFGIHPSMRQHGLGTDLLKITAFVMCRRFHCLCMTLDVQAINTIACKFYSKFGFKLIHENPNYYSFTGDASKALYLRYDLNESTSTLDIQNKIEFADDLKAIFTPDLSSRNHTAMWFIVFLIVTILLLVIKIMK
ncbi:ribosomal-protein-alanine N-acetyltransferase [Histomonas meleagridis]|uniref:ribosomal-protein-alanine N-acetyltransferase n=1 Tax=Histomonas meleagridis TaxID=135588 RepID=UPI0035595AB2|nr:ribosomal-protein-alanine N-acetyltransferase [Histomonas meleagridis]KAH0805000.1 ribosomal-protein-alanine N-acetyltransferase [Histomonas meleagridis]